MRADILRQLSGDNPDTPGTDEGQWVDQQDPLTGEIIRVWVPAEDQEVEDNPDTPGIETGSMICAVYPVITGGLQSPGTGEQWDERYVSTDYARAKFPANIVLTKRDRLTNVRNKRTGSIIWKEEEYDADSAGDYRATVFDVMGVTPVIDGFGRHIENVAFLNRAEIQ